MAHLSLFTPADIFSIVFPLLIATIASGCSDTTGTGDPADENARVGKRLIYNRGTASDGAVEWSEADASRRQTLLGAGWEILSEPVAGRFVGRRAGSAATSEANDSLYVVTLSDRSTKFITTVRSDSGGTAVLTPDGSRVVVYSGETHEIYIGNATGGGVGSIAEFASSGTVPSLSPDGMVVAYVYTDFRGESIHLVNVGGIDDRMIADSAHGGYGGRVSWSPDGAKVVYTGALEAGRPALFIVNRDGTGRRSLSTTTAGDFNPEWSPSGSTIAFTSVAIGGKMDIMLINTDGTGRRALTSTPSTDENFAHWSPDGAKLVYTVDGGTASARAEVLDVATGAVTVIASPARGRAFWDYTK